MPENSTRVYRFNPPGGMPRESFNRLIWIGGTIAVLFLVSLWFQGTETLLRSLFKIPIILVSLTFHEYSHARMADFLGDPTPGRMGRLSLNPLRHLEPFGTLLLFFTGFGWARPVLVDPANFRIPKRAMLSVAIAGPLSNLLLAVIGAAGMKLLATSLAQFSPGYLTVMLSATMLQMFITINLSLAIFNLLPIPPLDGSRVVSFFLPERYRRQYRQFEEMAPIVLMLLFALGGLSLILSPLMQMSFSALLGLFDNPLREISIYLLQLKSAGVQL